MNPVNIDPNILTASLLAWYDQMGRNLPWRVRGKPHPIPYHVWLSEIMLQQTTVATVKPYFESFINKWPTLKDFSLASLDDILHAWQGLGYYARARNMHKCAQEIIANYGGQFPSNSALLIRLPGVGTYTAAAIAAIAFEEKVTPVDGNIRRVLSRLFALQDSSGTEMKKIFSLAQTLTPLRRSGDFAQALMDLGATLCTPRSPRCLLCPWQQFCQGFQQGLAETLPLKKPKKIKSIRYAAAFVIYHPNGSVLLTRREEKGLLGGMMAVPTTIWQENPDLLNEAYSLAPMACVWKEKTKEVTHNFTHFNFKVRVCYGALTNPSAQLPRDSFWVRPDHLSKMALPTLMKKILAA